MAYAVRIKENPSQNMRASLFNWPDTARSHRSCHPTPLKLLVAFSAFCVISCSDFVSTRSRGRVGRDTESCKSDE